MDRLAAGALVEAKRMGLTDVTHLEFGEPAKGEQMPTVHMFQAYGGDIDDPRTHWGAVDAAQAIRMPVQQSHAQLQAVNEQLEQQRQSNEQMRLQEQQNMGQAQAR